MTDQKNLQKYLRRIEVAERWRDSGYKDLWLRCYKRWRNYVDQLIDPETKKKAERSNISIPYTFVQVETVLPRLIMTLLASRPYVSIKDREPSDLPNAEKNETLLDWQMNERMDFRAQLATGIKECCIYGTCVAFVNWRFEQKKVIKKQLAPVMDEETQEPLMSNGHPVQDWQPQQVDEILYDDPEAKFIDIGLFFVDPNASTIEDARYCGHITHETKESLQKMVELGAYQIDWDKVPKEDSRNQARDYRMSSVGLPTGKEQESSDDYLYEVIHYWEDNKHAVILNRKYLAADGENPYWHKRKPYKKAHYIEVPHEFYGMGIVEAIEDLQDELNVERNMRIDFRAFVLRRMWKVRKGADINRKQLRWRQGGIVEVDDMNDVQELNVQDIPNSTFNQEEVIKRDIQDATGAHDVVMGTSAQNETATGTMTRDNNASMRFKLIISNLEKELLVGIARLMVQLNQQFVDDTRVLRVTGDNGDSWSEIAPEEIQGEFDFIAAGTSVEPLANKEAFKQRMVELYQVAGNDPIYQQFPEKRINLLRKVFESFGIKDTESLLPTEQELLQMQQAQIPPQPGEIPGQGLPEQGMINAAAMGEQGMIY